MKISRINILLGVAVSVLFITLLLLHNKSEAVHIASVTAQTIKMPAIP